MEFSRQESWSTFPVPSPQIFLTQGLNPDSCIAGDPGSIPGLEGEGNGNPLQYPYLQISMDRGAWRATVHGVAKSWTQMSD